MHVDVIDEIESLQRLSKDWQAVYASDPQAQYFLSWDWMSARLRSLSGPWLVLAARPLDNGAAYVGFFPLRLRMATNAEGVLINKASMAGNYAADFTGFICAPELERQVASAFSAHLRTMHWAELGLEYMHCSADRLRSLLAGFDVDQFVTQRVSATNKDNVDNLICPYIALPGSFDDYLAVLSANTRQKLRRLLRKVENGSEFAIAEATPGTLERDLDVLLALWAQRWGERKGANTEPLQSQIRKAVLLAAGAGSLFMPVMWASERPVGVLASFLDPKKSHLLFYVAGRDETYRGPSPGLVLHTYSIRHAIAHGYRVYDFLRGNEPYKYSFGASERGIANLVIRTVDNLNLGKRLDARTLPSAVRFVQELLADEKLPEAERVLQQVLDQDPEHVGAMLILAKVRMRQNDVTAAMKLLDRLVELAPDDPNVWLARGAAFETQGFADAAEAYMKALKLRPDFIEASYSAGRAFRALGEAERALESFRRVQMSNPDYRNIAAHIADLEEREEAEDRPRDAQR